MDSRRGDRPSQVRLRPPSTGRPAPAKVRAVTPSPTRMRHYRRIERRRGLPMVMKAFLAFAVVVLGGAILWIGSSQVGPVVSSIVGGFGGLVAQVGSIAGSPAPTEVPPLSDAPAVEIPDQPYTNHEAVDVTVTVPAAVAGQEGYAVRLYVTLPDADPALVAVQPVGETSIQLLQDVQLVNGRNDFQASILGPGGESDLSTVTTWVLDTSKPKVSIISPKNNAQVSRSSVRVKGKSQASAEIRLQNSANGAIATAIAGSDGLWEASLAVTDGGNAIVVTATDLAGNANSATLNVRKGSGVLTAVLTGSNYRFKASRLPTPVTLRVSVTGPDGRKLGGATALFTLSVPGLEAIVSGEIRTGNNGTASFTTRIPSGATTGSGLATVLVTAGRQGSATDRQVLRITK